MSQEGIRIAGVSQAPATTPKSDRSIMQTSLVELEALRKWLIPPFQRPLKINTKVMELVTTIKADGGIIPGVVTLGIFQNQRYIVDGQHRIEAFKLTELPECLVDLRIKHFSSMAEMADEFVTINSALVRMGPDDLLRGLEPGCPSLLMVRKQCPFIGYSNIRRGPKTPIVSMSSALRCWLNSAREVPSRGSFPVADMLKELEGEEAPKMIHFMKCVYTAWGEDHEYHKMWGTLNLTITAWLWRRCVISQYGPKITRLTPDQFTEAMRELTADPDYLSWLTNRSLSQRDRTPCFTRVKALVVKRLGPQLGHKIIMPAPNWTV